MRSQLHKFRTQFGGILITLVLAAGGGLISGKVIAALGRRSAPYLDEEEFEGEAFEMDEVQPCAIETDPV